MGSLNKVLLVAACVIASVVAGCHSGGQPPGVPNLGGKQGALKPEDLLHIEQIACAMADKAVSEENGAFSPFFETASHNEIVMRIVQVGLDGLKKAGLKSQDQQVQEALIAALKKCLEELKAKLAATGSLTEQGILTAAIADIQEVIEALSHQ